MLQPFPARVQAGIYLLTGVAILSVASYLLDAIAFSNRAEPATYGAGGYMSRFAALRNDLPPGTKTLGYITDMEKDPGDVEFHLTQYAFAPAILDKGAGKGRYAIGNMVKDPTAEFMDKMGVTAVKVYPNGVVLFERKGYIQP
ncbi:hypothetical protein F183_A46160 [Bryobacterales bacterium F-183]|nr:hypothetical protein F183_A46160 [Bryobacterales bacterium F-183]